MNKYKLLIIICFFLVTLCLPRVTATVKNLNLLGKVIILDAGHGGKDEGASSGQIKESELNLILTKKLEKELTSRGATVYLTRKDNNDLSTTTVNRKRNDLYNRAKYINDIEYLEKTINNYKSLKNLSLRELKYKLMSKGIDKDSIENYIYENRDEKLFSQIVDINKRTDFEIKDNIYKYTETINLLAYPTPIIVIEDNNGNERTYEAYIPSDEGSDTYFENVEIVATNNIPIYIQINCEDGTSKNLTDLQKIKKYKRINDVKDTMKKIFPISIIILVFILVLIVVKRRRKK